MCAKTTYSESYLKNEEACTEKPIRPSATAYVLPQGGQFEGKTIYKESYLESDSTERVQPFIPSGSISKADGKISGDTTSKVRDSPAFLSFDRFSMILFCFFF